MIKFDKERQVFILNTAKTEYVIAIRHGRYLQHVKYGKADGVFDENAEPVKLSFSTYPKDYNDFSLSLAKSEYSGFGCGDYRNCAVKIKNENGDFVTLFKYVGYKIVKNVASPKNFLPYARKDGIETLIVECEDDISKCKLFLYYSIYEEENVITRYAEILNDGENDVELKKFSSLCLDLDGNDYKLTHLCGKPADEAQIKKEKPIQGLNVISSRRGASSHFHNPFFILSKDKKNLSEKPCYGFNFIFSGSFSNEIELNVSDTRVIIGLGEDFEKTLKSKESFATPEAVMTFSVNGNKGIRDNFYKFIRKYIFPTNEIKNHPVVLNTWEGCLFDINEELLVGFAEYAAKVGIDTVVVDDGWFSGRNDDTSSLGDWFCDKNKFKNGLDSFADRVLACGVNVGIWLEPEMISENSDLFRRHPEFVLCAKGRTPSLSRNQFVIDMTNPAVIEYLKTAIFKIFSSGKITYVKIDMNRNISECGSAYLDNFMQGETAFLYMQGVYKLLGWFTKTFPHVVIETCSGGGGRFDLGMLSYAPQIWASDTTSPKERESIQNGLLLGYPPESIGSNISNPENTLDSPYEFGRRYRMASKCSLGYELNILKLSDEQLKTMKRQISNYKRKQKKMFIGMEK